MRPLIHSLEEDQPVSTTDLANEPPPPPPDIDLTMDSPSPSITSQALTPFEGPLPLPLPEEARTTPPPERITRWGSIREPTQEDLLDFDIERVSLLPEIQGPIRPREARLPNTSSVLGPRPKRPVDRLRRERGVPKRENPPPKPYLPPSLIEDPITGRRMRERTPAAKIEVKDPYIDILARNARAWEEKDARRYKGSSRRRTRLPPSSERVQKSPPEGPIDIDIESVSSLPELQRSVPSQENRPLDPSSVLGPQWRRARSWEKKNPRKGPRR